MCEGKTKASAYFIILFFLLTFSPLQAQSPFQSPRILSESSPRPKIMILGTFHFKQGNLYSENPLHRLDILDEQRQTEVAEIVRLLEQFKPTKIAVEVKTNLQSRLDSLYQAYLSGDYILSNSETDQLGFRLAKRCGHARVYAVDAPARSYFRDMSGEEYNAIDSLLNQQLLRNTAWNKRYNRLYAWEDSLKLSHSLKEFLVYLNRVERINLRYGQTLTGSFKLGSEYDYRGPDLATGRYNRDLRVFSNLQGITESPQERILLIIGAGHVSHIRQAVVSSPEYELVEAGEYLEK